MAAATLTTGSMSNTFDTVAGTLYVFSSTGTFASGQLQIEYALTASPTVFSNLTQPLIGPFATELRAPGSKLRVTLGYDTAMTGTPSVNVEVVAAV